MVADPPASTSSAVTPADLAHIINHHSESAYQNVYKKRIDRDGNPVWAARILHTHKVHGPAWAETPAGKSLGEFHTPREAACAVVRAYRELYGPQWAAVFAARKRQPYRIVMAGHGRFRAEVWLRGGLTTIGWADAYPGQPIPPDHHRFYFPHRPAARAAILAFRTRLCRRFGLPPRGLFWRAG